MNTTIINSIKEICDRIDLRPTAEEGLNQFIEEYISFWLTKPDELQLYFITFNYAYKDERIVELYSSSNEYLRSKISLAFEKMNIRFEIQNSQKSELIDAKAQSKNYRISIDVLVKSHLTPLFETTQTQWATNRH